MSYNQVNNSKRISKISFLLVATIFLLSTFVSANFGYGDDSLPNLDSELSISQTSSNNTYNNITIINGSSYNSSYVPYSGATESINLDNVNISRVDRVSLDRKSNDQADMFYIEYTDQTNGVQFGSKSANDPFTFLFNGQKRYTFKSSGDFSAVGNADFANVTSNGLSANSFVMTDSNKRLISTNNVCYANGTNSSGVNCISSSGGSPVGPDYAVQFKQNGQFNGSSLFTFNQTSPTTSEFLILGTNDGTDIDIGQLGTFIRVSSGVNIVADASSINLRTDEINLIGALYGASYGALSMPSGFQSYGSSSFGNLAINGDDYTTIFSAPAIDFTNHEGSIALGKNVNVEAPFNVLYGQYGANYDYLQAWHDLSENIYAQMVTDEFSSRLEIDNIKNYNTNQLRLDSPEVYVTGNISAYDYDTRTDVYDSNKYGSPLNYLVDENKLRDSNGSVNHSAFGYSSVNVTRKVKVGAEKKNITYGVVKSKNETRYFTAYRNVSGIKVPIIFPYNATVYYKENITKEVLVPIYKNVTEEEISLVKESSLIRGTLTDYKKAIYPQDVANSSSPIAVAPNGVAAEDYYMMSKATNYKNATTKELFKQLTDNHLNPDGTVNYSSYGENAYKKLKLEISDNKGNITITEKEAVGIVDRIDQLEAFSYKMAAEMCAKNKNEWSWC